MSLDVYLETESETLMCISLREIKKTDIQSLPHWTQEYYECPDSENYCECATCTSYDVN